MQKTRNTKGQFSKSTQKKKPVAAKKIEPVKSMLSVSKKRYEATQRLIASVNAACQSYLESIMA